ncbi:MAG: glycosyltransferase, partial [Gemmatimonadetes bacterium]|nr:glycosyltransferase [Gemmatimonadota bacterium]
RLGGVPRVVARVGLETDTARSPLYRVALRRWTDVIVLNAEAMRDRFLARAPGLDAARVVTIRTGVARPERRAAPGAVRRWLGVAAGARVIGTVARLAGQKRLDRLLEALARLPADVHCLVAGAGAEQTALERLALELGVAGRLHLLGERDDVGDVLDALDVFVVCSDREGLSNAMLEALAAGVPVVSTPVSGAAEALESFPEGGAPGEIVGFDAADLAACLERLLADPARLRAMGAAAVRRAEERFGFERMLDGWEAVLEGALVPAAGTIEAGDAVRRQAATPSASRPGRPATRRGDPAGRRGPGGRA